MARIPKEPKEIFEEFIEDYKEAFGSDLISIVLHGSGARGEYIPGKSDINFLIVLSEDGIDRLAIAFKPVAKWHKRKVTTPLFLSRSHITSSLGSFPVEFLNLKACYHVVYGEDLLQDLEIGREHLRLQCERELKGKLIQLRKRFIESQGKKREIEDLIRHSLPAFLSIFQAMLYLKEGGVICQKKGVIDRMGAVFGLNRDCFLTLTGIREGKEKLKGHDDVLIVMEHYIEEIKKMSAHIDQLRS